MARQVHLPDMSDVHVNETSLALLRYIEGRSGTPGRPVFIPLRAMAEALDAHLATARRSRDALLENGLIEKRAHYLSNGGQTEDEIHMTDRGHLALYFALKAGY